MFLVHDLWHVTLVLWLEFLVPFFLVLLLVAPVLERDLLALTDGDWELLVGVVPCLQEALGAERLERRAVRFLRQKSLTVCSLA